MDMDVAFSGIGTAIVTFIFGSICGGSAGYYFGLRKSTLQQSQKAGSGTIQSQVGRIQAPSPCPRGVSGINLIRENVSQSQKAGDNATQSQKGGIE